MKSSFASSHRGHQRSRNEDALAAAPEYGIWLVVDGVGGHSDGDVAAATARDSMLDALTRGLSLADAIQGAHRAIIRQIAIRPGSNMGATVVALKLLDDHYAIAWVGDSRAYLFNGTHLRQLTHDHNPVSDMLSRGEITREQAANHPERHKLSRFLGVDESVEVQPEQVSGSLLPGEQVLLCSDGLSNELSDDEIVKVLRHQPSPQQQVEALVGEALRAGGSDNITVIVVGEKRPATGTEKHAQDGAVDAAASDTESAPSAGNAGHWFWAATVAALAVWLLW